MVTRSLSRAVLYLITLHTTLTTAQYGPGGQYGPSSNNNGGNNPNYGPYSPNSNNPFTSFRPSTSRNHTALLAHAILASLAFIILFPTGSILIRLSPLRYTWLIHAILQLLAYTIYTASFGLGIYLLRSIPFNILSTSQGYHPIIGIVVFVALFLQPLLGWMHHVKYKKVGKRTGWSYVHVWLGRGVVTLGMINGGLGLRLASRAPGFTGFKPGRGECVAYGVVAGVVWVVWVAASIVGERRRVSGRREERVGKEVGVGSDSDRESARERGMGRGDRMVEMGVSTPPVYKERDGRFA